MPLAKEKIELLPFLTTLIRAREETIIEAGLGLDLKGKKGRFAMADPRQLSRAVGHLLDNAIRGTPRDGQILIEVPKPGPQDDWSAAIVISDNGTGMDADTLAQAVGAGSAGGHSRSDVRAGLGIPLARQLIEAHGGTLELTSEEGVGTTAIVVLP